MNKLGKARQIAYLEMFLPFPLSNREGIAYGFGANRLKSKGSLLVMAKSLRLINDERLAALADLNDKRRTKGLIEMDLIYYGFEITPLSETELALSGVVLMDPKLDSIPEALMSWGTKTFMEFLVKKILKFSGNLKGTKYAKKLKTLE